MSGFTSEGTTGFLNGTRLATIRKPVNRDWSEASRRCIGPRQFAVNVQIGLRRLKSPNVISASSWMKCTRHWTTISVFSQLSPHGLSLIAHHNCLELIPQLDSKRSWIVWVLTAE